MSGNVSRNESGNVPQRSSSRKATGKSLPRTKSGLDRVLKTGFVGKIESDSLLTDDVFEDIDRARKGLLHTQACDGTWSLLFRVSPSVLPYVFTSVDFWLSVAIYLAGRFCVIYDVFEPTELGNFRGLHTMGFVLALMLNFYVNTSVGRMFETNNDAMNLIRCVDDLALALRGFLWDTDEQRDITRRCVDYLCAAHVFCYIGFTEVYTSQNLWEGINREFGLLTAEEERFIRVHRELGGSRMRECIGWCMEELHLATKKGFLPPPVAAGIMAIVDHFNDDAQSLFDFRYLPIPFVSEHLLVFFLHLYLPIQTFEMAIQTAVLRKTTTEANAQLVVEIFGCLLALLANLGFQGLFAVGAFLEQPYGPKICHSRISTFCRIAIKEARKSLCIGSPRNHIAPLEEHANQQRALRGKLGIVGRGVSVSAGAFEPQDSELQPPDLDPLHRNGAISAHVGIRVLQDLVDAKRDMEIAESGEHPMGEQEKIDCEPVVLEHINVSAGKAKGGQEAADPALTLGAGDIDAIARRLMMLGASDIVQDERYGWNTLRTEKSL